MVPRCVLPTPNVSMVDLVFVPGTPIPTAEEINAALKAAADGAMKGCAGLYRRAARFFPISTTIRPVRPSDSLETSVMEGKLARVVSWYDNEWGFSNG